MTIMNEPRQMGSDGARRRESWCSLMGSEGAAARYAHLMTVGWRYDCRNTVVFRTPQLLPMFVELPTPGLHFMTEQS